MKIARQFIAWNVPRRRPVPEGRCEPRTPMYSPPKEEERPVDLIIPSRRAGICVARFQAINCLATIIQSLRDKYSQHLLVETLPRPTDTIV